MSAPNPLHSCIRSVAVAKAFFQAVTKHSDNIDDILPQEDGESKLSVYALFSELFPEFVKGQSSSVSGSMSHGLTRLQFNKLGYEMYVKEQSRRVPSPHAKPGNPGYGFRQAKWRNTNEDIHDRILMFEILTTVGISSERCEHIRQRVEEYRRAWDLERRPCRCAGPGRPRSGRVSDANVLNEETKRIPLGAFASTSSGRNQDELRGNIFLDIPSGSKTRENSLHQSSTDTHGECLAAGPAPRLRGLLPPPHGPSAITAGPGGRVQLPAFIDGSLLWPALAAASLRSAMSAMGASAAQPSPGAAVQAGAALDRGPMSVPETAEEETAARARKRARDTDAGGGGSEPGEQDCGPGAATTNTAAGRGGVWVNKASLAHLLS
jgi:hypothetical protein